MSTTECVTGLLELYDHSFIAFVVDASTLHHYKDQLVNDV
jgi:hypothetical protein